VFSHCVTFKLLQLQLAMFASGAAVVCVRKSTATLNAGRKMKQNSAHWQFLPAISCYT